ncbi:MAG: glycosyltransferase family 4 protein [Candidatus Hinthialibacter antarcticus]|nr:glycosyltransferase family 4 protein [Candidatus Hinthialibacter antarcticus]
MKTLFIHQAFITPNEFGGTRHYELAQLAATKGHTFTIIASDLNYMTGKKVAIDKQSDSNETDEIQIVRSYTAPVHHRSFVWRIVSFFSFMVSSFFNGLKQKQIDVVLGTSPPIFQAVSAWLISLIKQKPFLLEIRDLWPAFAVDMGVLKNPILIWLSYRLENFLYARAEHIIVNSPAYKDYLTNNKKIAFDKVTLIPNGVDVERFSSSQATNQIRDEYNLQNKFLITYAGALGLANNIDLLLHAANHLKKHTDIHFLIVGDGKERPHLELLKEQLHLSNVTFAGTRPKSEIPEILLSSDVCTAVLQDIPMFRMTYPNKVFDYMAASKPTLLAIDGVIRQVIEECDGGCYVSPSDANAYADAVLNYYQNRNLASEQGIRARDYVFKHFNRHTHAEQFVEVLERFSQ